VLADWSMDPEHRGVVLTFRCEGGTRCAEFGTAKAGYDSRDLGGLEPFMTMLGPDGRARVQMRMNGFDNPFLAMGDHLSERLVLGRIPTSEPPSVDTDHLDNWSLVFRDTSHGSQNYASIGMNTPLNTNLRRGYVDLRNSAGRESETVPK
jgi:hypothetical protein